MDDFLENITYAELAVGRQATLTRTLTQDDITLFAVMSGDVNPAHMDAEYAKSDRFHGVIGQGIWTASLISALLGTVMPGVGTIYLEQDIKFKKPVRIGDVITVTATVHDKRDDKLIVKLDCKAVNQRGEIVADGLATVIAPKDKVRVARAILPHIVIPNPDHFHTIIASCKECSPLRTAIVHPVTADIVQAVEEAVKAGFILPVLVGNSEKIHAAAKKADIDITPWEIVDSKHSHAAASKAVELAATGKVAAIMKGSLHTDELMAAIVPQSSGLRTEYRISHAYIINTPSYHKPLIITDAAINIAPDAATKADICQNAITLWHILYGDEVMPKVAILAATEEVNPRMQATTDAAIVCKMADRGQITGAILDGPLAFDNAISKQAAEEKGIHSLVAGDADILLVPEIETGNVLVKQLTFLGGADAAGIVLGASVPIILTSRADSLRTRLLSCALAVKIAGAGKESKTT